jgi:hypothetical protein
MARVPVVTYCERCHCVIPLGWPKVAVGAAWRCAACTYEIERTPPATNVGTCSR